MPRTIRIRARDIRKSRHLQNSVVGYLLRYGYLEFVTEKSQRELLEGEYFIDQDDINRALREVRTFSKLWNFSFKTLHHSSIRGTSSEP